VNTALLRTLNPAEVAWDMERAGEAEVDEMGRIPFFRLGFQHSKG
jgi:hypothetical protein